MNMKKRGTYDAVQAAIARIEKKLGFENVIKARPLGIGRPSSRPNYYNRASFRVELGWWAPGGITPDRRDRIERATELRARSGIIAKLGGGRAPTSSCETPRDFQLSDVGRQMGETSPVTRR